MWELPGGLGVQPPSSFLRPPSSIYSFVLGGGQKITPPQIALVVVYTVCAIIAQFLSRQRYSIPTKYAVFCIMYHNISLWAVNQHFSSFISIPIPYSLVKMQQESRSEHTKMRKICWSPGLRPGPRWGSLQRSPRPPS